MLVTPIVKNISDEGVLNDFRRRILSMQECESIAQHENIRSSVGHTKNYMAKFIIRARVGNKQPEKHLKAVLDGMGLDAFVFMLGTAGMYHLGVVCFRSCVQSKPTLSLASILAL